MFEKVLIGIDGHEGGRDAIALARVLVADGGDLTLAYVHGGFPIVAKGASSGFANLERERAEGLLAQARAESGIGASVSIGSATIGHGLHDLARREAADLLVVGASRRGRAGRIVFGDDTRDTIDSAPCAVAVAPAGYAAAPPPIREIGVGYNGSSESLNAVAVAREIAEAHGARFSAFEAAALPDLFAGTVESDLTPAYSQVVDETLRRHRSEVSDLGGVEPHVVIGTPVTELTLYSTSIDLLVLGTRERDPIRHLLHHSVSQRVAHSARCPLLIITQTTGSDTTRSALEKGTAMGLGERLKQLRDKFSAGVDEGHDTTDSAAAPIVQQPPDQISAAVADEDAAGFPPELR